MPVWHEKTKELEAAGKLSVLGITEEQHADRSELFMRWKQMNWPVLVDSFNLLGVRAVPLTYLIDESGVIQYRNPKPDDLAKFLETEYPKAGPDTVDFPIGKDLTPVIDLVYTRDESRLNVAIELNAKRLEGNEAKNGRAYFQHGVLHRMRYDSAERQPGDFAEAIHWWGKALAADPGQYIWRRRIQQYGPRLDKPYPFYDWVETAQQEIMARGEEPVKLVAALSGAEIAHPEKESGHIETAIKASHPDPGNQLENDTIYVKTNAVVVPATGNDTSTVRVHLQLRLNSERKAHWNNESEPPTFWLEDLESLQNSGPARMVYPKEKLPATSIEDRSIEFEIKAKPGKKLPGTIPGRLFYYVCEGEEGTCMFLSQKIEIKSQD